MSDRVNRKKERRKRRAYAKPVLRSIDLVADQVMATGCKMVGSGNPGGMSCAQNNCVSNGS